MLVYQKNPETYTVIININHLGCLTIIHEKPIALSFFSFIVMEVYSSRLEGRIFYLMVCYLLNRFVVWEAPMCFPCFCPCICEGWPVEGVSGHDPKTGASAPAVPTKSSDLSTSVRSTAAKVRCRSALSVHWMFRVVNTLTPDWERVIQENRVRITNLYLHWERFCGKALW